MPNDHGPSQGRRPHYHRGRRGGRPPDRRPAPGPQEQSNRDHVDVEQIMRDIRSKIARRHGIDLTPQQIHELAARRLEAILEPRHMPPSLMEQMRRAAGERIEVPSPQSDAIAELDEDAIYTSHRSFLRTLRRWLNPILKLFFNPTPLVDALRDQAKRTNAAAAREAELYARQAEWNALHYEILQRLVTEVSRTALDAQTLVPRIEALAARIDFNERRVRAMEGSTPAPPARTSPRPEPPSSEAPRPMTVGSADGSAPAASTSGVSEGPRRRRRRRRGRRGPGPSFGEPSAATSGVVQPEALEAADLDGGPEDELDAEIDTEVDVEGEAPPSSAPTLFDDETQKRAAEPAPPLLSQAPSGPEVTGESSEGIQHRGSEATEGIRHRGSEVTEEPRHRGSEEPQHRDSRGTEDFDTEAPRSPRSTED